MLEHDRSTGTRRPGSRASPLLLLLSPIRRGSWRFIGDGRTLTHWVYIDDAIDGLVLAAERGGEGEVYIVAGPEWLTMQEFVGIAAQALGVEAPTRHVPVPVARALATVVEIAGRAVGRTPRLRREMVEAFLVNRAFDISKAKRQLGFEPQVDLREGLRRTVEWYEQNGYLQAR